MTLAQPTKGLYTIPGVGTRIPHNEVTTTRPPGMGIQPDDGNPVGPPVVIPGRSPRETC